MKEGIHPNYVEAQVSCTCGNSFVTRATKPVIKVDICSMCHPFFTGKQKVVDTLKKVEKFKKKFAKTEGKTLERKPQISKVKVVKKKVVKKKEEVEKTKA